MQVEEVKRLIKIKNYGIEYTFDNEVEVGDELISINSEKISSLYDFDKERAKYKVGDVVEYKIQRKNQPHPKTIKIKLISFKEAIKINKKSCENYWKKKAGSLMFKEWEECDYGNNHGDWEKRREEILKLESVAERFAESRFTENADEIRKWKNHDAKLISKLVKPEFKDINFKLNFFSLIFNPKIVEKLKSISLKNECCYSFILTGKTIGGDWDKKVPENIKNFQKLISIKDKKKELFIDKISEVTKNYFFNLIIDKKKKLNIKYQSKKKNKLEEKLAVLDSSLCLGFENITDLLSDWFEIKYGFNNAKKKLAIEDWCKSFFLEYPDFTNERIKEIKSMDLQDAPIENEYDDEYQDDKNINIFTSAKKKKINGKESFVVKFIDLPDDDFLIKKEDEMIVIDDIFYNSSKRFKKIDLIFSSEVGSLIQHFQDLNQNYRNDPKEKYLFQVVYNEILRIIDFEDENFKKNENKLILLVKKNELEILKNKQIEKFFLYLGNNFHSLTHQVESNKKYKVQKINELNEKNSKKLYQATEEAADDFINSGELQVNENTKNEFTQPLDNINYINNLEHLGIKRNQLNNLTHCWFEGVNPWLGKYVILKDLNQLLPTKNLQYLRLSDCIGFNDFELPQIKNLKFLRLDFHNNHHRKKIDPDHNNKLKNFSNLPNLESLELRGLYNTYSNEIVKSAGFTKFGTNRWGNIQVDFKDIHQLTKLKEIYIFQIKGSNLQTINALPNAEKLTIHRVYNITKEMNPDEKKYIENGTSDKDLKFLNNSKSLKELTINIGDIACKDDLYGEFLSSYYKGNGNFINYISHNIIELNLNINLDINNQLCIQDFINNICNRFLKLEKLELSFGFAVNDKSFNLDIFEFNKKIQLQIIDFKKFSKLKNLKSLKFWSYSSFMKYKTINFQELINLKKIQTLSWHYESIDFNEFRKTRKIFKEEKYADPSYYDYDFDYYSEEDENYKKDWTRFNWIDTEFWGDEFNSLENRFIEREKEENQKKFKKSKEIIKKKKKN